MKEVTCNTETTKNFSLRRRDFSIFIAQAEVFTCEVLSQLLKEQGYNVVGRAVEMEDTLQQIRVKRPQCVILDADIAGRRSFDIVRQSYTDDQRTKFILYTSRPDLQMVGQAMQIGFFGFLYASDGLDELYRCFQTVSNGGCYYSTGFMALLKNSGVEILEESTRQQIKLLSSREREVVRLVGQGHTGDEIAGRLSISYRTLANHKSNIARKLNMESVRQLVHFSINVKNHL